MKKYVRFGVAGVAFVLFLAGAWLLYQKLAAEYSPGQNLVVNPQMESAVVEENRDKDYASESAVDGQKGSFDEEENSLDANGVTPNEEDNGDNKDSEAEYTGENAATTQQENLAIDFTMENTAGEAVTLYDFVGKPIVLNFWASWCGPCKAEIPDFQVAYEQYAGEIEFMMVNMTDGAQETKESATAFIEKQGYTLPFYFDTQLQGAYTYGVYSLPTTFFINAEGEVIAYAQGMIDAATLEQGIYMIYNEE